MQAKQTYRWATEMVEAVTKQHREQQACQRRLAQMQAKREKDAKRAARKQIVFAGTTGATDALGPDNGDRRFWPITEA